ncbi:MULTISPECIES: hypothetical protein [Nocardia]|uniref:hypothetical protein n=1 Tax=Nocardia TaxID=1817 RepID=UPI00135A0DAA|nr:MULTISPECIES: hypothetical protein [Nocardia]
MTTLPSSGSPDDHLPDISGSDPAGVTPEWAPVEPLPSSEMLLAALAGPMQVTATDSLDPASDLVICQERHRLAISVLASGAVAGERVQSVATALDSARDLLVTIVDDAVGNRLLRRRRDGRHLAGTDGDARPVSVHTESIGEIPARMAALWVVRFLPGRTLSQEQARAALRVAGELDGCGGTRLCWV